MRNIFSCIIAAVFLASCAQHTQSSSTGTLINGFDNPVKDRWQAPEEVRFIHLSDSIPLSYVNNVILHKDTLFVQTDAGIYCYDTDGNYLYEISRHGRAANEWTQISAIYQNSSRDELRIVDAYKKKIMAFSNNGTYLGSEDMPERLGIIHQAFALDDGRTAFSHVLLEDSAVLYTIEDGSADADKAAFVMKTPLKTKTTGERVGNHPLSVHDGRICFVMPFSNIVYTVDNDDAKPLYRINTKQRVLTDADLSDINGFCISQYLTQMQAGNFAGVNNIYETDHHMLLSFFESTFVLIDKATGSTEVFSPRQEKNVMYPLGLVSSSEEYFIGVVDCLKASTCVSGLSDDCTDTSLLKLKDIVEKEFNSNPYIVLYRY